MPPSDHHAQLWSHLQSERLEVFAASRKRLDYMVRLAERLAQGRSLLNIGCGDGYLERRARERRWTVVSVDPDAASVERLQAAGADARCGSIESLPAEPHSADVVVCTEVFEHLAPESLQAGLEQIRRVLKPAGVLIGTVPYREDLSQGEVYCPTCRQTFHRWGHVQSFDETKLRSILGQHLRVQKVRPVYLPAWNATDWKGKLSMLARLVFSWIGVHGATSHLLFVAGPPRSPGAA